LDRKTYLRSLLARTPAQVAEEDFLYIESRRLEQSYNKLTSERAELLRVLGGREGIGATGGVNVGVGGGAKGANAMADKAALDKKKKGGPGWELEGLNGGGLPEGWAGEGSKRKATVAQGSYLLLLVERRGC
jgi:DNA methyltransferase 1-associated protein 1